MLMTYYDNQYKPVGPLTIAQVRVEVCSKRGRTEEYMCTETGCPSGSIWRVQNMYTTLRALTMAAKKRNLTLWEKAPGPHCVVDL